MDSILEKGAVIPDRKKIVFLGDSITDDGTYIAHLSAFFLKHMPDKKLEFINLGVSSETASGLSESDHPFPRPCVHDRLDRALELSRPDWVVVCYGMNDGIYYPFSEQRFSAFKDGIKRLLYKVKAFGAKAILMTPPPFNTASAQEVLRDEGRGKYSYLEPFKDYNSVLRRYSDWILSELDGTASKTIDLYYPLMQYIDSPENAKGNFVSKDGIHPNIKGHWVIAGILLKELFHLCIEREPEYMDDPESSVFFQLVMQRHRILSSSWKEYVGHTNPEKENAVSIHEAESIASDLERRIKKIENSCGESCNKKVSDWKGYKRHDFYVNGREAIFVEPKIPTPGNLWIWRAEFFDAFPNADMAMLEKGWHLAYYRICDMYGCPEAIEMMAGFHDYMIKTFKVSKKTALFGFSRGGLYAFNYAARYPNRVSLLYLDAPVLDIRSWPGGKGEGIGSPEEWQECLTIYGLDEYSTISFKGNPLDKAKAVAKAGIPIILVAGDADEVVPFSENGKQLVKSYESSGGKIKLILKKGIGHHPHSLEDPKKIVDFIIENSAAEHVSDL